jgi:sulfite exporter TauE/SafE
MGLMSSGHCLGMCGGIVGVASPLAGPCFTSLSADGSRVWRNVLFNVGRLASYGVFGALAGAFGPMAATAFRLEGFGLAIRVMAGGAVFLAGLSITGVWPQSLRFEGVGGPLWSIVGRAAKRFLPLRTAQEALLLGTLWGAMPCGMVYSALALAVASGSSLDGLGTMVAFGLGTSPVLLAFGATTASVRRWAATARGRWALGLSLAIVGAVNLATIIGPALGAEGGKTPRCCAVSRSTSPASPGPSPIPAEKHP